MPKKGKKVTKKANKQPEKLNLTQLMPRDDEVRIEQHKLYLAEHRLATFRDWPFDGDNACNPSALADAGFYHIPSNEEPDACRCFCCYKELDGWEPEDCPWEEHRKHSPDCAFLALKKPVNELTVGEFLKLECERNKSKLEKIYRTKIQEVDAQAAAVELEFKKLI